MMICRKCTHEIREGAKFCPYCGSKTKLECSKCGKEYEVGHQFCENCGFDVNKKFENKKEEILVSTPMHAKKEGKRSFFDVFRHWFTLSIQSLVLLLLILFLFLPIGEISFKEVLGGDIPDELTIKYNLVDTFSLVGYLSEENEMADFAEYIQEILEDTELSRIPSAYYWKDLKASEKSEIKRAMNEINIFYTFSIPEVRQNSTIQIIYILTVAILYITALVVYLIFFVFSIINMFHNDEKNQKKNATINIWILTVSLILLFAVGYLNRTMGSKNSSSSTLILIFTLIGFIVSVAFKYLCDTPKLNIRVLIKKPILILSILLAILLINSAAIRYIYSDSSSSRSKDIVDAESIHQFLNAIDQRLYEDWEPIETTDFEHQILSLQSLSKKEKAIALKLFASSNVLLTEDIADSTSATTLAIFSYIIHIAVLMLLVTLLRRNIKDLYYNKESSRITGNITSIVALGLWSLNLIILTIFSMITSNILEDAAAYISIKIGTSFYFAIVILIGYAIFDNVFRAKKEIYTLTIEEDTLLSDSY